MISSYIGNYSLLLGFAISISLLVYSIYSYKKNIQYIKTNIRIRFVKKNIQNIKIAIRFDPVEDKLVLDLPESVCNQFDWYEDSEISMTVESDGVFLE